MVMEKRLIFVILAISFWGCKPENRGDCFTPVGNMTTEMREIPAWEGIILYDKIDLEIVQGNQWKVEVTAGSNLLKHLKTELSGGALVLEDRSSCNWVRRLNYHPKVVVTMPDLEYIDYRGAGNISTRGNFLVDHFLYVQNDGSGTANLNLTGDTISAHLHTGFGDLRLSGSCQVGQLYTSDASTLNAEFLVADHMFFNHTSVADAKITFTSYLYAEINRTGNLYYKGPDSPIDLIENGTGRLIPF